MACGIVDYFVEECEVTVTLKDGREFDLFLEDCSIAYCDGWHYELFDTINTLFHIVRELNSIDIDIETEDIESITYDNYELM